MDELFRVGLTNAAWATALAVAATAAARFCRRRPAVVHVLWLLVLIKLVTPSLLSVELPAREGAGKRVPKQPATKSASAEETYGGFWSGNRDVAPVALGSLERHASTAVRESGVATASRAWHWRPAAFSLWFVGALAWGAVVVTGAVRFRRLIHAARPASAELTGRTSDVAAKLGLRSLPKISLVQARVPPMLWASLVGRPRLILPEELWARFDPTQQDAVLAHELAHWKRRDHWVRRLEAVVLGLYWWYPVAWWARRQLEQAEEECCDAWVVWSLPAAANAYAEALVTTTAFLSGHRNSLPLGASGAGRTLPLKRRLNMILRDRLAGSVAHTAPRVILVFGILALPFLPALASGQQAGVFTPFAPANRAPALASQNHRVALQDQPEKSRRRARVQGDRPRPEQAQYEGSCRSAGCP